jgi:hypothetical protein
VFHLSCRIFHLSSRVFHLSCRVWKTDTLCVNSNKACPTALPYVP